MRYTEDEALRIYLDPGMARVSSFWAALRDARNVTGRDPNTGAIVSPDNTATWLGAIGYLSFMDQVGTALIPADAEDGGDASIVECLRHFGDMGDRWRQTLYALRCALAHDYSLFNKPRSNRADRRHLFALVANREDPLVGWPQEPWNGRYDETSDRCWTVVNLEVLGHVAEEHVFLNVHTLADNGRLRINTMRIPGGPDELVARYSFLDTTQEPLRPDDDPYEYLDSPEQ